MKFRLVTIFWAFAVVAASLAVFGAWGLLVMAVVFGIWARVVSVPRSAATDQRSMPLLQWVTEPEMVVVVLFFGMLVALVWPSVTATRTPSLTTLSQSNLKQLTFAIQNYHDKNGHFPPPYVTDGQGQPLYSWRAEILPYIQGNQFHKKFRYDERWDSPHNKKLCVDMQEFISPRVEQQITGETHYLAVVGDETVWDPRAEIAARDVTDGTSNTMFILEVGGRGVHWSEPRDLTMDEAIDILTGAETERFFYIRQGYFVSKRYAYDGLNVRCVAYVDGHAQAYNIFKNAADARALLTKGGREPIKEFEQYDYFPQAESIEHIIHWGRIWGVACWLFVVLLPALPAARRKIFPGGSQSPIMGHSEGDGAD